jgi:hypothetical protein
VTRPARVFVNGAALDVPSGATALDAVRGWRPEEADAVARGASVITDSRGLPTPADTPVEAGAIFRVIPVRNGRRAAPGAADDETP